MKRGVWRWLKQYHLRHHYQDDQAGYGVSSPLWDYVFKTTRK
jgi:sterol desaturase/sphingolipid hydroxylase (fatty acid hydroxylase superfamily)